MRVLLHQHIPHDGCFSKSRVPLFGCLRQKEPQLQQAPHTLAAVSERSRGLREGRGRLQDRLLHPLAESERPVLPSLGRAVQRETKRNPPPKSPASLQDQFHLPKARLTVSVQIQLACASQCRSAREASALLCCSSLTIKHWPIHVDQLLAWHCLALRTTMTGEHLTRKLCQSSPKSLQYSFDPNTSSDTQSSHQLGNCKNAVVLQSVSES